MVMMVMTVGMQAYFPMPEPALDPRGDMPWYSFEHGPVHYTVMSSEHGRRQVPASIRMP